MVQFSASVEIFVLEIITVPSLICIRPAIQREPAGILRWLKRSERDILTSIQCRGEELMELYHYSPVTLHGAVLNQAQKILYLLRCAVAENLPDGAVRKQYFSDLLWNKPII